jgi:hypothetical protein
MSSVLPETLEVQMAKQEQRINRIREAKDLEREWSKEMIDLYKQYQLQRQKQEEYLDIIEMYKNLIKEIETLQKQKEDFIKNRQQAQIDKEKERILMEEYNEKMKQKKAQFDIFMKQKGKEAFEYLKKMNDLKKQFEEEIHRYEKKKKVKENETLKSKEIIDKFREEEEKKKYEEMQNYNEGTMNVLYKITTPFHNNGNKIDYSTTRFHNIVVMKHEENLDKELNMNAFQKAEIEREKSAERKKLKEKKLKEFQENEEKNFKELIRKQKAKENLERLNAEFDRLNQEKKKNKKNLSGKINLNANLNNAKSNDKRSEFYLNKLLEKEQSNRLKVLRNQGCPSELVQNMNNSTANEDSMRQFYEEESILNQNDDYLTRQMKEYNKELEKINEKFFYEEPISRDPKPLKDKLNRVNPIDINAYTKSINNDEYYVVHKEPLVQMSTFKKKLATNASVRESQLLDSSIINNQSQDISRFSIIDMLNISRKELGNVNLNENKDNKKVVKDFMSKVNSINRKSTLEPIIENKGRVADVGLWNIEEEVEGPQSSSLIRRKSTKNNNIKKEEKKEEKKDDEDKKEEKKDDKWKFSKDELYERKKKMLKDKSNFQKK